MERPFGFGAPLATPPFREAPARKEGFRTALRLARIEAAAPRPAPAGPPPLAEPDPASPHNATTKHTPPRRIFATAAQAATGAGIAGLGLGLALVLPPPGSLALLVLAALATAFAGLRLWTLKRILAARAAGNAAHALRNAEARVQAAEDALARAQAENAAKSRFLSEMSHELRTPLNAIIGFSEMMAGEVLGPHGVPSYGDYARDIHASGRHLLSLADDILDLARIETGHRTLLETAVALEPLAQDCAHMMRLVAAERAVRLVHAGAGAPRLWADERALRQITLNLVANAVKFTPPGGEVTLSVGSTLDGAPFILVEDTGPGIGEAELPFASPHARESTLDPATGRGAGLGLAIVHALTELHGGALSLARRPGGGTSARVSLPASRRLDHATDTSSGRE